MPIWRWYSSTFERGFWKRARAVAFRRTMATVEASRAFLVWTGVYWVALLVLRLVLGGLPAMIGEVVAFLVPVAAWIIGCLAIFLYHLNNAPAELERKATDRASGLQSRLDDLEGRKRETDPKKIIASLSEHCLELLANVGSEANGIGTNLFNKRVAYLSDATGRLRRFPQDWERNPALREAFLNAIEVDLVAAGLVRDQHGTGRGYTITVLGWAVILEMAARELAHLKETYGDMSEEQLGILRVLRSCPSPGVDVEEALRKQTGRKSWTLRDFKRELDGIPAAYYDPALNEPSGKGHRFLRAFTILNRPH